MGKFSLATLSSQFWWFFLDIHDRAVPFPVCVIVEDENTKEKLENKICKHCEKHPNEDFLTLFVETRDTGWKFVSEMFEDAHKVKRNWVRHATKRFGWAQGLAEANFDDWNCETVDPQV